MNGRFAIINFLQYIQPWGYYLCFETDTPCHLIFNFRHRKPAKVLTTVYRRGLAMHHDPSFPFKPKYQLDQQEEGDTIWHGFHYEPSYLPKHVWFYLSGTVNGVDSPSTSPIMHLPVRSGTPMRWWYQYRIGPLICRYVTYNTPRAMNFEAPLYGGLSGIAIELFSLETNLVSTLAVHNTDAEGKPTSLVAGTTILTLPPKFQDGKYRWLYYPLFDQILTPGLMYAVVLTGDPSQPDADVLCWYQRERPGEYEELYAWNGERVGNAVVWTRDEYYVRTYEMWAGVDSYQPGPPTPEQIPS